MNERANIRLVGSGSRPRAAVGFIGAGNIARAVARGLGEPILCTDNGSGRAADLVRELGGYVPASNAELAEAAEVVILAHETPDLSRVADEIRDQARIVVSFLGLVSVDTVREAYPDSQVVRVIPNLAVELRQGVSIFATPRPGVGPDTEMLVRDMFARMGRVVDVPEQLLPLAIGCSGVGPAYWAFFVDAWAEAAASHGLPKALATSLIVETMSGTAALLKLRRGDSQSIVRQVATRGGSTERGLTALADAGMQEALIAALDGIVGAYERGRGES
jgi:pyrroline-5-carboxylate reductase